MLPNFYVIGAAKSGTTSLHKYLGEHPDIHMSDYKEPNFFIRGEGQPHRHIQSLSDYENLFDSVCSIRGESSTSYSLHPWRSDVPERIHALTPDAKLLYLVRDPIDRLQSVYMQLCIPGTDADSFRAWLGPIHDPMNYFMGGSQYMNQIDQYLSRFSDDQLIIVDSADLASNRRDTLKRIFDFLGVDRTFWADDFSQHHNTAREKRRYSHFGHRISQAPSVRTLVNKLPLTIKHGVISRGQGMFMNQQGPPSIDDDLRAELTNIFKPEVDRLRSYTGQPFQTWSI
jgi:hypothetical protein